MEREILFRGIRKGSKDWIFGDLNHIDEGYFIFDRSEEGYKNSPDWFEVYPESVGQFTGLLDKNGDKIFEGDVVKDRWDRVLYAANWNYRLCWIAITSTNFHHADFYDWIDRKESDYDDTFPQVKMTVEIIGNIHDNPGLVSSGG